MISTSDAAKALAVVTALCVLGCDRDAKREAGAPGPEESPPVRTGNVTEVLSAERAIPRLPTARERLLRAVREGDRARVNREIAGGANLDTESPVLVAAVRGEGGVPFLKWLVDKGTAIDIADEARRTPLSWAAGEGSTNEVQFLLERGADIEATDQLGRTPLHYAVFSGQIDTVVSLLEASANVNAQDSLGSTPLMYACAKNQRQIVRSLRKHGADPRVTDNLGRTAAERAHGEDNPCG